MKFKKDIGTNLFNLKDRKKIWQKPKMKKN